MLKIKPKIHDNRNSKNLIICFLLEGNYPGSHIKLYLDQFESLLENKRIYAEKTNSDFMYFDDGILDLLDEYCPYLDSLWNWNIKEKVDYVRLYLYEYFEQYENIFYIDFDAFLFGEVNVFESYDSENIFLHAYQVVYPHEHTLDFFNKIDNTVKIITGFSASQICANKKAIKKLYEACTVEEFLKEREKIKHEDIACFAGLEHYLVYLRNFIRKGKSVDDLFCSMNYTMQPEVTFGSKMLWEDWTATELLDFIKKYKISLIHPGAEKKKHLELLLKVI
jgi:hypothetical protein|tara:strand:+ start:4161 stop:4997 length:837 start_codon:yes stop_codon:yes gene_type:complete